LLAEKEGSPELDEDTQLQSSQQQEDRVCSECNEPEESDLHTGQDSCIWDSNELQVLRRAFKATGEENARLRSQVCVLQDDVGRMTAERCDQHKSLETTRRRLHDAQTANKRLHMLASHLKTELDRTKEQLNRLRSDEAERNDLSRRLESTRNELSAAGCRYETSIECVEAKWMKVLDEQRLADAEAKTQLNSDVARLENTVKELVQQLCREKEDHSRTRKGLEHLRVHFSTLSTPREKSNCVHKDELDNWTY